MIDRKTRGATGMVIDEISTSRTSRIGLRQLSVLIPVYNEVSTLQQLVDRLDSVEFPIDVEFVLVDDGSTDGTHDLLRRFQSRRHCKVLFHPVNRGKAAAIRTAIEHASGDVFVIQDADLEYDPTELPALLEPILRGEADVVYGSRFKGVVEDMAPSHLLGNRFLTWLTNRVYGTQLTDMETCYKMALAEVYRAFTIEGSRFELEPEITAKILRQGRRIVEVPISFHGRSHNEGKKISWRDGFGAVRTLLRYRH
jgi:glycosyltransferase involved in cell wall biosynthesis